MHVVAALELDVDAVEIEARHERVEVGDERPDIRGRLVLIDDADVVVGAADRDEEPSAPP